MVYGQMGYSAKRAEEKYNESMGCTILLNDSLANHEVGESVVKRMTDLDKVNDQFMV